jgi:hypothetical protein
MNCAICKRQLTDPDSVRRGIGPVCLKKVARDHEQGYGQDHFIGPFEGDVILQRTEKGACTNIPQTEVYHSPTGFEWGYGGSGPADLALNILRLFTDPQTARRYHQAFKWEFIAPMPREGGVIKGDVIRDWLDLVISQEELPF